MTIDRPGGTLGGAMARVSLHEVTAHLDRRLRIREIEDYPGAWNGLQIENGGAVTRVGAAVDATLCTLGMAVERGIDLLLVHHGLFWSEIRPVIGASRAKLALALRSDLALYSAHLPLDLHPEIGNSILLARALGLAEPRPFLPRFGNPLGWAGSIDPLPRPEFCALVERAVGGVVRLVPGGPERVGHVGVVTGGAGEDVAAAAVAGIDTFVTGEGPHWSYALAEECGVNLLYAGHYATETFGVRALAEETAGAFGLPWEFLDHPTGL